MNCADDEGRIFIPFFSRFHMDAVASLPLSPLVVTLDRPRTTADRWLKLRSFSVSAVFAIGTLILLGCGFLLSFCLIACTVAWANRVEEASQWTAATGLMLYLSCDGCVRSWRKFESLRGF